MKKFLFSIFALLMSVVSYADTCISATDVENAEVGKQIQIPVMFKNIDDITLFMTNFEMPEGLKLDGVTRGKIMKERDDDDEYIYTFNFNVNLCVYNTKETKSLPSEGELMILKVTPQAGFKEGKIRLWFVNGSYADATAVFYDDLEINVKVASEPDPSTLHKCLSANPLQKVEANKQYQIPVTFKNVDNLTLFMTNFEMPEGLTLDNVSRGKIMKERDDDEEYIYTFNYNINLCVYNTKETKPLPLEGELMILKVTPSASFTEGKIKLWFVNGSLADATAVFYEDYEISVTAATTGIDAIQTISDNAVIYNIAGQRVNANAKGLVIKNGKKFINK